MRRKWIAIGVPALVVLVVLVGSHYETPQKKGEQMARHQPLDDAHLSPLVASAAAAFESSAQQNSEGRSRPREISAETAKFHAARRCVYALESKGEMTRFMQTCGENMAYESDPTASAYFESCRKLTAQFAVDLPTAESDAQHCISQDLEEANELFFAQTQAAALAGDPDAQICYLATPFGADKLSSEQSREAYKANGARYVQEAIERGDWRIVSMLRASTPSAGRNLMPLLPTAVSLTRSNAYRMNRLLRLGAVGVSYPKLLDALGDVDKKGLHPAEVAEADVWAARVYSQHFSKSPRLREEPWACRRQLVGYAAPLY